MYEDNVAANSPHYWPAGLVHPPDPKRSSTSALVVVSFVLSLVAVLGVLLIAVWLMVGSASAGLFGVPDEGVLAAGEDGGGPLTGGVPNLTVGAPLGGSVLSAAVTDRIHIDGSDVADMKCPDTPKVDQGVVTVCHGWIYDTKWAVVVYFESSDGTFTLEPISW